LHEKFHLGFLEDVMRHWVYCLLTSPQVLSLCKDVLLYCLVLKECVLMWWPHKMHLAFYIITTYKAL